MEYSREKKVIRLSKEINNLDKFVIDFCNLLDNYVLVSGYISILFGRSRATEDVDLLIPQLGFQEFKILWAKIHENQFECINTFKVDNAFKMLEEHAIRFARKNNAVPNMEFKIIHTPEGEYSLNNKLKVILDDSVLFISPLEIQIAYKLDLGKQGNKKDLEDAKHIYELFKEKLDKGELTRLIQLFNVEKEFNIIK